MDDLFDDKNEQKAVYNNIKFGKVGDWFKGTLTDNTRQIKNNLSTKGEMQTIFELKAQGGSFHAITNRVAAEAPTLIAKGEFWSYITSKPAMLQQLKNAKLGQIVGFRYAEDKKAKTPGFNDAKIIKVYLGDMDPEYQGETKGDF